MRFVIACLCFAMVGCLVPDNKSSGGAQNSPTNPSQPALTQPASADTIEGVWVDAVPQLSSGYPFCTFFGGQWVCQQTNTVPAACLPYPMFQNGIVLAAGLTVSNGQLRVGGFAPVNVVYQNHQIEFSGVTWGFEMTDANNNSAVVTYADGCSVLFNRQ